MTRIPKLILVSVFACGFAGSAFADRVGSGWITIEQATQKAKDAGYTELSKIEADDGRWEGKGLKNGQTLEFHMDPMTGALSGEHQDH